MKRQKANATKSNQTSAKSGAVKSIQPVPTAAERLQAAGRLNDFEARREERREQAAQAKATATSDRSGPDVAPSPAAVEQTAEAAELATRVAGLRKLLKSLPKGKRIPEREAYDWAGEHLSAEADEIDPADVPNRFCLSVLIEAIATPEGMERFLTRHKATSAGQTQAETFQRFADDGRDLEKFFDKVEAGYTAERTARLNGAIEKLANVTGAPPSFVQWAKKAVVAFEGASLDENRFMAELATHAKAEAKQPR